MPKLTEKATGKEWQVPDSEVQSALASGLYKAPDPDMPIQVDDGSGHVGVVPFKDLERHLVMSKDRPQDPGARAVTDQQHFDEATYGGIGGELGAAVGSGLDAVTLGGAGALTKWALPDLYHDYSKAKEVNPGWSTVGTIGGLGAVALATGGAGLGAEGAAEAGAALAEAEAPSSIASFLAKTPAGYVNRVGNTIRATGEGAGLAGRVAAGTAAGAAEGGLYGVGNAVQQLAASDDPLTVERMAHVFAGNIGSGVMLGGALGGGAELAITGAKAAASTLGKVTEAISKARSTADIPEELMTKEGLAAGRKAAVDQIREYQQAVSDSDPWIAMEKSKVLTKTKYSVEGQLDDAVGLAEDPARALRAIRTQRQALELGLKNGDAAIAKLAAEDKTMAQELNQRLAALSDDAETIAIDGKMAQRYSKNILGKSRSLKGKPLDISTEAAGQLASALDAGEMQGARAEALKKLPGLIDHAKSVEDRLVQLRDAGEALKNQPKGLVATLASSAGHNVPTAVMALAYGHPIAAGAALASGLAAKAVGHVAKRILGVVRESGMRSAGAVESLASGAARGARGAARAAIPSSVSILNGMHADTSPAPRGEAPMATAYRRASAALFQQMQIGPDGQPSMTDIARRQFAAKLAPIAAVNPKLADQIETLHAATAAFLAVRAPKPPSFETGLTGPSKWTAPPGAMAKFARSVAAATDPGGVEERAVAGTLTPEDVEAYKALYPARLASFIQRLAVRLPALEKPLTLNQRISLQRLTGVPLVPALTPALGAVIQGLHQQGTADGVQPPAAPPRKSPSASATGSLEKQLSQQFTPAQKRA